jgi:pyridoxine/pyridoxamine 5'-phosphate oxidase
MNDTTETTMTEQTTKTREENARREDQYVVYANLVDYYKTRVQASDILAWASAKHDLITIGAPRELAESFRQRMVAANRRKMNAQHDAVKAADRDYASDGFLKEYH